MKLDKCLCFMFLFAYLALTLHKTRQKHAFFGRITRVTVGSTSDCDCIVPAFEIPRVA